jgi:hypothetical protein
LGFAGGNVADLYRLGWQLPALRNPAWPMAPWWAALVLSSAWTSRWLGKKWAYEAPIRIRFHAILLFGWETSVGALFIALG